MFVSLLDEICMFSTHNSLIICVHCWASFKGTPPRSAILIAVVWPSRAVFALIVFISLFRQDSCCPSSLLLCLIVMPYDVNVSFLLVICCRMYEKSGIDTSHVVDANNVSIGTRKTLLSRKDVNVEAMFSFVRRCLQDFFLSEVVRSLYNWERGWRSKPHKATDTMLDVAMFYCSPFPFKPRLLWVLPP